MLRNKRVIAAACFAAVLMSSYQLCAFADSSPTEEISVGYLQEDVSPASESVSFGSMIDDIEAQYSDELPVPEVTSAEYDGSELTISWKSPSNADGCLVYRQNVSTGRYKYLYSADNSLTFSDYDSSDTDSKYYIASYKRTNGKLYVSRETDITSSIKKKPIEVQAPPESSIIKANRTTTALRIFWTPVKCSGYEVYMIVNGSWKRLAVVEGSVDNYRISGLESANEYSFTVRPFNYDASNNPIYAPYSEVYTVSTKASANAPAKVNITKANKTDTAIRIFWTKVDCSGYQVYAYIDGSWKLAAELDSNADYYRLSKLSPFTQYSFRVRAFNTDPNGAKVFGEYSSIFNVMTKADEFTSSKPVITSSSKTSNAVRINWNAMKCDGYEIYRFTDDAYLLADTVDSSVVTKRFSGLKPSTSYSYAIRAFKLNSSGKKIYSQYSEVYSVKTKTDAVKPAQVSFTKANKSKTAVRLFWGKTDCDGYELYMKKDGKWTLIKDAAPGENNFRLSGLESGVTYTFSIRAYNLDSAGVRIRSKLCDPYKVTTASDIVVTNGVTYINGILIVNKTYSLPSSYGPGGLTSETEAAFAKMQAAARADGYYLTNASGYRSYWTQKYLYDSYVARDGVAAADRYSARPGHSEHQTGLALDVNNPSSSFDNSAEAKWLAKNCYKYGFIIRYPQGKEQITGYKYESWHIRYVGKTLATTLTENGLTLEEYFNITSQYK